jgi:hypothetical protein
MRFSIAFAAGLLALPPAAGAQTFKSSAGDLKVETVVGGLASPWALAFLPDGRMLVTEKAGRLRIATPDGKLTPPLGGVPKVAASGQGGLHDVIADRNFAQNKTIYFCFAEPAGGGARTSMARATLGEGKLDDVKVIFQQDGPLSSGNHFGCRIVQASDGSLFLTQGDHFTYRDEAQNLANHIGKIVRVTPDGEVPKDNPFVGRSDARPEIYALGVRNIWRLSFDRKTGDLWAGEVGQNIWEEVNLITRGGNYGWNPRESFHRFKNGAGPGPEFIEPLWEYHHLVGKSITGGNVYRGKVKELEGYYIYADYVTGRIWGLKYDTAAKKVLANREIFGSVSPVITFGEDQSGELYFCTVNGAIFRFTEIETPAAK